MTTTHVFLLIAALACGWEAGWNTSRFLITRDDLHGSRALKFLALSLLVWITDETIVELLRH